MLQFCNVGGTGRILTNGQRIGKPQPIVEWLARRRRLEGACWLVRNPWGASSTIWYWPVAVEGPASRCTL